MDGNGFMISSLTRRRSTHEEVVGFFDDVVSDSRLYRLWCKEGEYGKPEGGRDACRRRCPHRAAEQRGGTQAGAERIRRPVSRPEVAAHQRWRRPARV